MPNMRQTEKSLGVRLRVIETIKDFSCVSFCPHLVSIAAPQNQEWGTSEAQ